MATAKLRTLDTAKSLTPYELELINKNFFDIEAGLNSIGGVTPGSPSPPPISVPVRHDALLELADDDHLQYLLLAGRSGQTIRWVDFNLPSLTIQPLSLETIDKIQTKIVGFNGTGLEVYGRRSGSNPDVKVLGILDISNGGGTISIRPSSSLINIALLGVTGGVVFDSKVQAEINPHGRVNNLDTAANVSNFNLGVINGDYWVSIQMSVRTANVGASCTLVLNWNDGFQARSFSIPLYLDSVTGQQNRMLAITKGSGDLTYSLTFSGVTIGRVDIKLKAQRMSV